ncbi:MAG: nucleotide sugar dehydrogenase [Actinomycetia bacterium]|nr:nucleotide sugar dehydrogenase [Actinomycetes bacterium]
MRTVIVGQGYVGLPLAMEAVAAGHDVVGFEINPHRLASLGRGESYVGDVSSATLQQALATGRYAATKESADLAGFDVAVITVPTPLHEGNPDLSAVEMATAQLGSHLKPGATVVLESTTWPGTTQELVAPLLEERSGLRAGTDFHVGYSPERIDPGNREWGLVNTPKVVSGLSEGCLDAVDGFYRGLVDETVPVSSTAVAELTKLLENTFRHVNIALVNELAMFAHALDIDIWETITAASTKPFGFMPFRPGPGVGGHCLPVDPSYLSWRVQRSLGSTFRFVVLANDINEHMPLYVVDRVQMALNDQGRAVRGARILILGVAYKANSSDDRETPAYPVIERLLSLGAEVRVADQSVARTPFDDRVARVEANADEAATADLVLVLTDHDDFELEALAAAAPYVLDTRRAIRPGEGVEHL